MPFFLFLPPRVSHALEPLVEANLSRLWFFDVALINLLVFTLLNGGHACVPRQRSGSNVWCPRLIQSCPDRFATNPFGVTTHGTLIAWTRLWPLYMTRWFFIGRAILLTVPSTKPKHKEMTIFGGRWGKHNLATSTSSRSQRAQFYSWEPHTVFPTEKGWFQHCVVDLKSFSDLLTVPILTKVILAEMNMQSRVSSN